MSDTVVVECPDCGCEQEVYLDSAKVYVDADGVSVQKECDCPDCGCEFLYNRDYRFFHEKVWYRC